MKKVLFLPFLQIPSGHHQVADALIDGIKRLDSSIVTEKVDLLHYGYGKIERLVSGVYIKWITYLPQVYSWIYHKSVCKDLEEEKRFRHYELLFLSVMQDLINEKKPDVIVCTHALPSYMLSQLKERGIISIPIINAYTDFFINHLWGMKGIDYHFAPSILMKQFLLDKGVEQSKIAVTGIPVHPMITRGSISETNEKHNHLLITGGSLGVGLMEKLVAKLPQTSTQYSVLCGKNEKLYKQLLHLKKDNIRAIPFISSREEMAQLYSGCDGIITKPGGVTVSESLHHRKPIFVYHTLPGQEEMNLEQLEHLGIAIHLKSWQETDTIEQNLRNFFESEQQTRKIYTNIMQYHAQIEHNQPARIIAEL
ncbi:MGDG synthase family glycosyltransferase [Salirhabdus sp. Marseille-P4669]|uniref:MGDG synthase family glycosyltransferase n=1 Tax=Salirhabdus sp. Marseille-P4669 TaxID=2042310 RepID=UPI000C79CC4F|nr:glycosyltransferase [Salirhabdus sp. Marseille-P4669]